MTTGATEAEFSTLDAERVGQLSARDRRIWIAFACAVAAHVTLLVGFVRSPPRLIGDPDGNTQAVAVSFVTEAELLSKTSPQVATPPPAPSPAAAPAPPTLETQKSVPQPPQPAEPEPAAEPDRPTETVAAAQPEPPPADLPEQLQKEAPDLLALPDPAAPASEQKKAPDAEKAEKREKTEQKDKKEATTPPKKQKVARRDPLDLSLPSPKTAAPTFSGGGGSGGIERPPGITQSGANDDFARGVIRALQKTMPQLSNIRGRVTVRIILDDNGNISSVAITGKSDIAELNQSVVFATKQTSFPIPPNGATPADKTFNVTYIYR